MIEVLKYRPLTTHAKTSFLLFALLYVLLIAFVLPEYLPFSSVNFILGIIVFPFTLLYAPSASITSRNYPWALLFVALSFFLKGTVVLFLAIAFGALTLTEQAIRRLPFLSVLTLAFMSATVQYMAGVFSFPIRLSLTHVASLFLKIADKSACSDGSLITFRSLNYSVDPACMGIKMLLTSLLCGVFILALFQQLKKRYLKWYSVILILVALFFLNLLSNLFRILLLVYFDIGSGTMMHEIVGLICLLIYVVMPTIGLVKWVIRRWGKAYNTDLEKNLQKSSLKKVILMQSALCILLILSSVLNRKTPGISAASLPNIPGYIASRYDAEVVQYSNVAALVYIKKINGVFSGEHNPVMCWLGQGYNFSKVAETNLNGSVIYTGVLNKKGEQLYTAWWYDNGCNQTASQFGWRWRVLKGEKNFSIINVTCASKEQLYASVDEIKLKNTFLPALK